MGEAIANFTVDHKRPILISVFSALLTFAGTVGAVKTEVADQQRQIEQEHVALNDHLKDAVSKLDFIRFEGEMRVDQREATQATVSRAEFSQFTVAMNSRLDDLRVLLVDIRDHRP